MIKIGRSPNPLGIFGNALYAINKHASIGVELSHWRTDYLGLAKGDAVRAQVSLIYNF